MEANGYKEYDGDEGPSFFCVAYHNFYPKKKGSRELILEDGSRIKESCAASSYTFFDHYEQFYRGSFIDDLNVPHVIYTGLGSIRQYENLILSQEEVEHLNTSGLYIFLYENLTFEIGEKKKFYITENKTYRPISYHLQFELTPDVLESMYSFELETIDNFVVKNNLTSVRVLTTEYRSNDVLGKKYKNFSLGTKDIFISGLFESVVDKIPNPYQHNRYLVDRFSSSDLSYKFWSTNWRYDLHRHLIALYLADKSVLLSWPYKTSIEQVKDKIWFDLNNWQGHPLYDTLKANDYLITTRPSPFIIDIPLSEGTDIELDQMYNTPAMTHGNHPDANPIPVDQIKRSFCAVVTESVYAHPLGNFTEKTITVIKSMRPFVLVAPPNTIEHLQKLGFKTFSDIWDESYDQETNHEQRMLKIFETLEWINSKSIDELKTLYDKVQPILEHNFNHLQTIRYNTDII